MERSQNWPDHRSLISKFRDKHFRHTVTLINRWKFQGDRSVGVAMTRIATFFWGEVFWRDLVTWPWELWVWNLHMCKKRCMNRCAKNGGAEFWDICEKPQGRCSLPPPPARRGGGGAIFYFFRWGQIFATGLLLEHVRKRCSMKCVLNLKGEA